MYKNVELDLRWCCVSDNFITRFLSRLFVVSFDDKKCPAWERASEKGLKVVTWLWSSSTQFWWEDVTESDTCVHSEQGVSREIFKSFFSHFDEIKFNFQEQEDVTFFTSVRLWRYDNVWVEEMDEEAQKGTRCSLKNCDKDRSSSRGSLAGSFCPIIWHYLTWPSLCKYEQLSSHNTINYNQPHSSPLQISVIVGMATEWGEESLYAGPLHWDVRTLLGQSSVLSPLSPC